MSVERTLTHKSMVEIAQSALAQAMAYQPHDENSRRMRWVNICQITDWLRLHDQTVDRPGG